MLSSVEENYVLQRAYVPEHVPGLMTGISDAEPFLEGNYLLYVRDNWAIVVGYPLEGVFSSGRFEQFFSELRRRFIVEYWWLIVPESPASLADRCRLKERDYYYRLRLDNFQVPAALKRPVDRAKASLSVESIRFASEEHAEMTREFLKRSKPGERISELFRSMPAYLGKSDTSLILNARDESGRLTAFYIVELGAKDFATYVVGCHSKRCYVPHASDLLFLEMVRLAQKEGKLYVNLGLGVNDGIRRFKEKWGGRAFLPYLHFEYYTGIVRPLHLIRSIESKL
jgi:hypothetical protein